jgi:hypothetical protein
MGSVYPSCGTYNRRLAFNDERLLVIAIIKNA